MGRHKGGNNQSHTKEEKIKYVKMMLEEGYSAKKLEKICQKVLTRRRGVWYYT